MVLAIGDVSTWETRPEKRPKRAMSYSHYQHTQHPAGTSYPYAAYHPGTPGVYTHPQTQAHAAYQGTYASGVTGYGAWPYPYSYIPQQQPQTTQAARPVVQTTVAPATVTTSAPGPVTPRTTTFTSYTPTQAAGGSSTIGRGRKQSNFRGLFTKECTPRISLWLSVITRQDQ